MLGTATRSLRRAVRPMTSPRRLTAHRTGGRGEPVLSACDHVNSAAVLPAASATSNPAATRQP